MTKDDLFNLEILLLTPEMISRMGEVKTGSIFEPSSNVFNKEGLFSTTTFGQLGSTARMESYGYIDLKVPVFHPLVFKQIVNLKGIYGDIIAGTKYAKWDNSKKDFEIVKDGEGETGFSFFLQHVGKIDFQETGSLQRSSRINITKKFTKEENMLRYLLVIPAGLREYSVNKQGQPQEDEINNLYRKVLMTANMISNTTLNEDSLKLIDPIRYRLQMNIQAIYEYIANLLGKNEGKNKFIQGKWAKRGIINGTRNVITPFPGEIKDLDDTNNITVNHTVIGLYQYLKAIMPITIFQLHKEFINNIMNPNDDNVLLVNTKTMKSEFTQIPVKKKDDWLTNDGVENIVNKMAQAVTREEPVMIADHYLMLVIDTGDTITCLQHTDEIPEGTDKKYIRPITYGELFYISIYDTRDKYPGLFTRYPITGLGSIYPSWTYVKTTAKARTVKLIKNNEEKELIEYIKFGEEWYESLSCSPTHIAKLGADYDGDKCSYTILYSDEAIQEIKNILNDKGFYINNGVLNYSSDTNTTNLIFKHMSTGGKS